MECRQGLGTDAEADRVLRRLRTRGRVDHVVGEHNAIAAAALYRHLRVHGITVRKPWTFGSRRGVLESAFRSDNNDKDFTRIANAGMGHEPYA